MANNHTVLYTDVMRRIFYWRVIFIPAEENVNLNGYIISDFNEKTDTKCTKMYVEVLRHFNTERLLRMAHLHYVSMLHKSLINSL